METGRLLRATAGLLMGCLLFLLLQPPGTLTAWSPHMESLPLFGRVIAVDPGHGGYDAGCTGASGSLEKDVNLSLALCLGQELRSLGASVIFTREMDEALIDPETTPGYKKRQELDKRIDRIREADADLLLSIHMNAYTVQKYRGAQLFYLQGNEEGQRLADCLQEELEELGDPYLRAPSCGEYYVLNACKAAVLVECGFLSNPEEEALLLTEDYRKTLARALARGVVRYFE